MSSQYENLIRILGNDIPGEKKTLIGLTQVRGIGYMFANSILQILKVDPDVIVTDRNSIEISGEKNDFGLWEKKDESPLIVTGPVFDEGGIFTFKITLDAQDEIGTINDVEFEVQVSVTDVSYHQEDVGTKETEFRVKSYYDKISNF